jgi:DnaJ-class molecular chaperone
MPKPKLIEEESILEQQLIETMIAGLREWRSDLNYPQSHSDMQACVRGVLKMFSVKRLPISTSLRIKCHKCEGIGIWVSYPKGMATHKVCDKCSGMGWIKGE